MILTRKMQNLKLFAICLVVNKLITLQFTYVFRCSLFAVP